MKKIFAKLNSHNKKGAYIAIGIFACLLLASVPSLLQYKKPCPICFVKNTVTKPCDCKLSKMHHHHSHNQHSHA